MLLVADYCLSSFLAGVMGKEKHSWGISEWGFTSEYPGVGGGMSILQIFYLGAASWYRAGRWGPGVDIFYPSGKVIPQS